MLLANLGDADPIEYGGFFVFGGECARVEVLEPPDDDGGVWTVYAFDIDRCTDIDGVLSDNPYHPDMAVWFADELGRVAGNSDVATSALRDAFCSDDPIVRAGAYRAVGEYYGFDNLDSYPVTLTRREAEARYR